MGGIGSGQWRRRSAKNTVEDALTLAVGSFSNCLFHGASGTVSWNRLIGSKSSLGFEVNLAPEKTTITLLYRWKDTENVRISVELAQTNTQFGGKRWWFRCPLAVRGFPCERRAMKLHLPPFAKFFGCRKCHELTYRSSQEAHRTERSLAQMEFARESTELWESMR